MKLYAFPFECSRSAKMRALYHKYFPEIIRSSSSEQKMQFVLSFSLLLLFEAFIPFKMWDKSYREISFLMLQNFFLSLEQKESLIKYWVNAPSIFSMSYTSFRCFEGLVLRSPWIYNTKTFLALIVRKVYSYYFGHRIKFELRSRFISISTTLNRTVL